eukprot:Skav231753  [mRNA]  locus=scaffold695:31442:33409:+ [translate_table: standard]
MTNSGTIKLWFHLPILGGGPSPTEDDLKNKVVAELATRGVPYVSLVSAVAQIFYSHKVHYIKKVMSIQDVEERWNSFQELAQTAGVHLSTKEKDQAARKIQRSLKRKGVPKPPEIDMGQLTIPDGTFVTQDGTPINSHHGPFTANGQGLVLTNHEEISQWVQASKKLCCDEFAALIPSHHEYDTALKVSHIHCQGRQKDGSFLLFKATLIQFGEKPVQLARVPHGNVDCPMTQVLSLTVFAEDFQDQWKSFTTRPAKHILNLFSSQVKEGAIKSVWGHSYRADGKQCAPNAAQSIQIHIRLNSENVHPFLKESGHNNVYALPKEESQAKPDAAYAVIWTGSDKFTAELKAKASANALGIVRNKQMFGFRTLYEDFNAAWESAHPDKDAPKQVKVRNLYKLQNLPVAFAQAELRQWLESLQWDAKPIRRLGTGVWLVGAAVDPPKQTCLCNEQLVLIQTVQSKVQERNSSVIVGQPIAKPMHSQDHSKSSDLVLKEDSWALYRERKGLNTKQDNPMPSGDKPSVARDIDGPTTARLNEQDQKIESLRKKLDLLETHQTEHFEKTAENFNKADAAFKQHAQQIDQVEKNMDQKLQKFQSHNETNLKAVRDAVQASAKANEDQFAMLRQMLQEATNVRRKTPRTTPRASPEETDEDLG